MGLNNSNRDKILERREEVARKRLRGWTMRQIAEFLCCSLGTIQRDLAALDAEWRENAAQTIEQHKTRVLAELEEVKRSAWAEKDHHAVLKALKAECDLLGLEAPQKVEYSGEVNISDARERLAYLAAPHITGQRAAGDLQRPQ